MKIRTLGTETLVELSEDDVWAWQNRPDARWPCATIDGPVWARFDKHGDLVDTNAGENVDGTEFNAMFSDALASHNPEHPGIRGEPQPFPG